MKTRTIIYAEEGYVLTDCNIYGTHIFLADGACESDFYEITEAEYHRILEEQNAENV